MGWGNNLSKIEKRDLRSHYAITIIIMDLLVVVIIGEKNVLSQCKCWKPRIPLQSSMAVSVATQRPRILFLNIGYRMMARVDFEFAVNPGDAHAHFIVRDFFRSGGAWLH